MIPTLKSYRGALETDTKCTTWELKRCKSIAANDPRVSWFTIQTSASSHDSCVVAQVKEVTMLQKYGRSNTVQRKVAQNGFFSPPQIAVRLKFRLISENLTEASGTRCVLIM